MNSAPAAVPATWALFAEMADFAKLTISSQNLRKGGKHLQSKHNKSRSLKSKIIASAIAAVLVVSSAVPAITTGLGSANAASVDDEATGATDVTTIGNTQDNIVWTNATYFDYLTDDEKSGGLYNFRRGNYFCVFFYEELRAGKNSLGFRNGYSPSFCFRNYFCVSP